MRTQFLSRTVLGVCFVGASLHTANADAASDARKAIEANFAKMSAALNKKDVDGYAQFYTDDVVIINSRGERRTKPQITEQRKQIVTQAKSIKSAFTLYKFALQKGSATATTLENILMIVPNPSNQKEVKLGIQSAAVYTWVQVGNKWKIKQIKVTTQKMTLDGKPVSATAK